jgi:hypothetical protein
MIYAAIKAGGGVDARAFALAREAKMKHPALAGIDDATLRREAKEAALMVTFDEEAALANLPHLLPTDGERREAVDILRKLVEWRPEAAQEARAMIARVEAILGLSPDPDGEKRALPAEDETPEPADAPTEAEVVGADAPARSTASRPTVSRSGAARRPTRRRAGN